MSEPYNPLDWYWTVNGSTTQTSVYSSKAGDYVPFSDAAYQAWLSRDNQPTRIASEAELGEVLAEYRLRPNAANVLDGFKETHARKLTLEIVAKVLFSHENRIRVIEGKQPVSAAQFKAAIKELM